MTRDWRILGVNHLAMAHALGQGKEKHQTWLAKDLADWIWGRATACAVSRPAYLGFTLEAYRNNDAWRVQVETRIAGQWVNYCQTRWGVDPNTALRWARDHALPMGDADLRALGLIE